MIWQFIVIVFFAMCIVHEAAHYFVAKKLGVFERWAFEEWYIGVGIALNTPAFWKDFVLVAWAGFVATVPFVFFGSGWFLVSVALAYVDLMQIFSISLAARRNPFLQIYPETNILTLFIKPKRS